MLIWALFNPFALSRSAGPYRSVHAYFDTLLCSYSA